MIRSFLQKKLIFTLLIVILSNYFYHNSYSKTQHSKNIIRVCGDGLQIILPTTVYMYSYLTQDKAGEQQFLKSFFFNLILTYALKILINKDRPQNGSWSFPSGHTSASFQAAAFFQKRYGCKYGLIAYLGAGFVGFSRIHTKKHYFEDVLAGACIGVFSAYLFTTKYIVIKKDKNSISLNYSLKF